MPWIERPTAGDKARRETTDETYIVKRLIKIEITRKGTFQTGVIYAPVNEPDDLRAMNLNDFMNWFERL